jgi:hypothetical protein
LRDAARATLEAIAAQCDAVRCDMAMLMENDIVERTWGWRAGERPASEYWAEIIPAIKQQHRNFLFMAEAYWDRESGLLQQGFDYCYDKRLYDRMEHGNAESIRQHLCADAGYQRKLVRFLENHDEPRAATAFATAKHKAVAVAMATLPGARLFHEGQFEGRKVRTPVFLGRRPAEGINRDLCTFYETLLRVVNTAMFNNGKWSLCARTGWPDNLTFENLLAWSWESNQQRSLVVMNLSDSRSQARIHMPWEVYSSETWDLDDELSGDSYRRDGGELQDLGLYVDLGPWSYHFFRCRRPHQVVFASAA